MTTAVPNIAELATTRKTIMDSFGDNDSEATDLMNMDKLSAVEAQIENATFETDAEKLAGYKILFELNDAPDFADQFKAKLFSRIHQFA
jgi:anti-sigma28 factor (negative regulator of flagellin synthesis)